MKNNMFSFVFILLLAVSMIAQAKMDTKKPEVSKVKEKFFSRDDKLYKKGIGEISIKYSESGKIISQEIFPNKKKSNIQSIISKKDGFEFVEECKYTNSFASKTGKVKKTIYFTEEIEPLKAVIKYNLEAISKNGYDTEIDIYKNKKIIKKKYFLEDEEIKEEMI